MTTETISLNQIALEMNLSRKRLKLFVRLAEKEREQDPMVEAIAQLMISGPRHHSIEATAFHAWLAKRGRRSPISLDTDPTVVEDLRSQWYKKTTQYLGNTRQFAELRDALIKAGWFEYAVGDHAYGYARGDDYFYVWGYFVEQVGWYEASEKRKEYVEHRSMTHFHATGAYKYEKHLFGEYPSLDAYVDATLAKLFDRRPAKLGGLSFLQWALSDGITGSAIS